MLENKKQLILPGFLILIVSISGALVFERNLKYEGRVFPGVFLCGQSYGDISKTDAVIALDLRVADAYRDGMTFVYGDQTFTVDVSDLGVRIDTVKSADKLFAYGHGAGMAASIGEQLALLRGNIEFENELSYDGYLIEEEKWKEISRIETPTRNFTYAWKDGKFAPVPAQKGDVIDRDKLQKAIADNLKNFRNDPVPIELVAEEPVLKKDTSGKALLEAQNLIGKKIVIAYGDESWEVAREDFMKWIGFTPDPASSAPVLVLSPDKETIKDYLANLVPEINREPVNANLEFKDGKVGVFALSQDGVSVDIDKSADKIGAEIFQTKNYDKATDDAARIVVEPAVDKVTPELTTDNIDNMGITSLLATGESDFHGSTKSRVHNVTVGASKFNGVLIGPGDTFSFDTLLGGVGAEEGYLPELVIKKGKTIAEYGGGLCQVSTTAFRGAVQAGLEIKERTNHAYAVKYYAPQGTDATIYPPDPDLVFVNNTPAYILLQTRIAGTKLYFDYYGTDDGRKTVMEGPVVYERSAGGAMKTWWKQTVFKADGSQLLTKTFYSNYKPASLYPVNGVSTSKPATSTTATGTNTATAGASTATGGTATNSSTSGTPTGTASAN